MPPPCGFAPAAEESFRGCRRGAADNEGMARIALIEDDRPTGDQLQQWLQAAAPEAQVQRLFSRDDAEAALLEQAFDVVLLDIELGRERHAGVALINAINKHRPGTPVLVVSAMPAAIYRGIMKALDAWDYLQKTTFDEAEFVETFLEVLRAARSRGGVAQRPAQELQIDPLWQRSPTWRGQRLNLPLTAQRILATLAARPGQVVGYDELFDVVKSGRSRDNVRKHVAAIRDAFRDIEPQFDGIENVPMRGFRWVSPA